MYYVISPNVQVWPYYGTVSSCWPSASVKGTCSLCGGPVMMPQWWWSVVPPVPYCASCGAQEAQSFGPLIPMKKTPSPLSSKDYNKQWDEVRENLSRR